jgi:hypothetical protein
VTLGVRVVAVDPVTPTTVYAGTQDDGVFKTTNGGGSWTLPPSRRRRGREPPFFTVCCDFQNRPC